MATQTVTIPTDILVDLNSDASLTDGTTYALQVTGGGHVKFVEATTRPDLIADQLTPGTIPWMVMFRSQWYAIKPVAASTIYLCGATVDTEVAVVEAP